MAKKTPNKIKPSPLAFTYKEKYTKEEVMFKIYESINGIADRDLLIGTKIILKNNTNNLNAEIYLDTAGTSGNYRMLRTKIVNNLTQVQTNIGSIDICSPKFINSAVLKQWDNKTIGYYWDYDRTFYGTIPNFNMIVAELFEYLKIMDIIL